LAGGRLVEAGDGGGTTAQQIEVAIGEQTAAVFHVVLDPKPTVALERVVAIAHASGVPVIVDAAAELPPVDNLRAFAATGADLVIFSGGKEISGPNDTGILCGRGELVSAAAAQAFPNRGIGRSLKVSKEQIVGLIFALRRFAAMDYEVQMQRWQTMAQSMCDRLRDVEGISARVDYATTGSRPLCIPRTRLQLDEEALGLSVAQVETALEQGQPAVAVMPEPSRSIIWLNPQHLADGEEEVVARRFGEVVAGGPLMNRPATQSNTR
jgi:L-seryl-tRNA(Ser) seleniumtransferase